MNVDKVAAMQAIGDLKSKPWMNPELCNEVLQCIIRLSKPGAIKRAEFNLSELLAEVAKIDFSKYETFQVSKLFQALGESLSTGLMVADHGYSFR